MAFFSIASGASHGLRYVAETVSGTTPSTPQTAELAHTSCSLVIGREALQPATLRNDRMMPDARTGTNKISGNIECEFGAEEYDPLLEAALAGTWTSNVLKAGKTQRSFTFERAFTDIGQYGIFAGCFINQLSISIKPEALVTASFAVVGLSGDYQTSPLAVPVASKNPASFDAFTGELKADGTSLAVVTGIDFTLDNGLEALYGVGSRNAVSMRWGRSKLSGTLSAFFMDSTLLRKFLDETPVSLDVILQHNDVSYLFSIPRLIYTGAENGVQDEGPISLSLPWQASIDTTLGTSFQITRTLPGDI